jgi:hypothetical protein
MISTVKIQDKNADYSLEDERSGFFIKIGIINLKRKICENTFWLFCRYFLIFYLLSALEK